MSKSHNVDMINGGVLIPLICYSLPIVLTQVLQLLFNAADIVVVGQFVGNTAVAAVGSCAALINLMINLFIGISLGATVVLAAVLGANQKEKIHDLTHTIFSLGIIFGIFTGILGCLFAALLVRLLHLTPSAGELLDAAAPGGALVLALVRLSSLFNTNCRARIVITNPLYQRLPFAVSWTDAAGNVEFRLATFFLEFLALLVVTVLLLIFFFRHREEALWEDYPNQGNVARRFLILVGIVEIIADSTRYDSALMHFFLIKKLNPYASFISITQVFSAVCILLVFIHYMRISVKTNGWSWYHFVAIILFVASLVGIGYMGEYRVQRTAQYVLCYLWQGSSLLILALTVIGIYRSCVAREYENESV